MIQQGTNNVVSKRPDTRNLATQSACNNYYEFRWREYEKSRNNKVLNGFQTLKILFSEL